MAAMLGLLLKNRLTIIIFSFTKDEPKNRAGRIIGTAVGIIIFSTILYYSIKLISLIYNKLDLELADLILNISLDYIFAIIFIIIILTGIATSFYTLYSSKDLELLLGLPISYKTVFTYKFIEILITNSYLFIIILFPFLIAYGISSKIPLAYYPAMLIIFISVISIPTSIGALIGIIATRYINPNKTKEIIGVVGGLLVISIYACLQIVPRYINNNNPEFESMGMESIKQFIIITFDKPFLKFLPSIWGSNALFDLHSGAYGSFGLNFILISLTAVFLIFVCIMLSQKLYYSGWSASTHSISRKTAKDKSAGSRLKVNNQIFSAQIFDGINNILVKDFKILFRTPARLMQIFIPFLMYIFLFWLILTDGDDGGRINFFIEIDNILFLFFPMVIIGIVNMNVSGNNIGGEGLNYWIIKLSPILTKKLIQIKIVFSSTINILCGTIVVAILYFILRPELPYIILALVLYILFSWGVAIIGTSIGAIYPVFEPAKTSRSNISFIGGLLFFISLLICLISFAGIVIGVLYIGNVFSWPNMITFPIILALCLIIDLALYYTLLNFSSYRLNKFEWKS